MKDKEYYINAAKDDYSYIDSDSLKFLYNLQRCHSDKCSMEIKSITYYCFATYSWFDRYPYADDGFDIDYIKQGLYREHIDDYNCFNGLFTWHNFAMLCEKLKEIYSKFNTIEEAIYSEMSKDNSQHYVSYYLQKMLAGETMIQPVCSTYSCPRMTRLAYFIVNIFGTGLIGKDKLCVTIDEKSATILKDEGIINKKELTMYSVNQATEFAKTIFPDDPSMFNLSIYHLYKEKHGTDK